MRKNVTIIATIIWMAFINQIRILEQISNSTVLNFKYISSDISYQAYFSYESVWGYEVLNSCHVTNSDEMFWN